MNHFRELLIAHALGGLLSNSQIAKNTVEQKIEFDENLQWHADTAIKFADAVLDKVNHAGGDYITDEMIGKNKSLEIIDLNLSTRTKNALLREDIKTLGEVMGFNERYLLRVPNFGRACLAEIKQCLAYYGLCLSNSNYSPSGEALRI